LKSDKAKLQDPSEMVAPYQPKPRKGIPWLINCKINENPRQHKEKIRFSLPQQGFVEV
jgi:hypothetical protein